MSTGRTFSDLLHAAMMDAAIEGANTQLQATIETPEGDVRTVRLIVIPEDLPHRWPKNQPAGSGPPKQSGG